MWRLRGERSFLGRVGEGREWGAAAGSGEGEEGE